MSKRRIWLGAGVVLLLALTYHFTWLARIPPGLDRDAAANGLMALNWLRDGLVPFWMPHASAPEPLIVWLQTATTALFGPSVVALRSASALFLSLAAVVVYGLALEVARPFAARQRWWAALLAGIVFACNSVVTQLARTGLRATTLPLLSGLLFLLLLRAWRTNARGDYGLAGLVLGLAAYTYLAARFLPIVVVIFVALAWWLEIRERRHSDQREESPSGAWLGEKGDSSVYPAAGAAREGQTPRNDRARMIGLVIMVLVAFIVVSPQLIFFLEYPNAFWERAQRVSLFANPEYADVGLARLLADKVLGLLLMYGVEWSGQYNQAARPLLSPLPFVGLLLSLPLVVRWHRQPAILLMVVAWFVLLLPDLIGGDRMLPHELRVIGAFVPVMVLSGVGLAYGLTWLARYIRGEVGREVMAALLALVVVVWGFVEWFGVSAPALAQSNYEWFARRDVAVAEAINASDAPLLVPLNEYSRSVIAYLTADRVDQLLSGIDANGQVVQPESSRVLLFWPADPDRVRVESISYRFDPNSLVLIDYGRAYVMPPAGADVAQLQNECAAQPVATVKGEATGEVAGALCEVDFAAFAFPQAMPAPTWAVDELYGEVDGEELRLLGIDADRTELIAGAEVGITSYWRAERPTDDRWRYFVHLLDDRQSVVAGDDLIPGYGVYETRRWQTGEIVPIRQRLQLPESLAPGRYWIEVGLYDPSSYERAVVEGSSATRTLVGPLKVPLAAPTELAGGTPLVAHFGDELALDSYRLESDAGALLVTLRLAALRHPEQDYTLFLHVENEAGEVVAQIDAQPLGGAYPTQIWDAGEKVVAEWRVELPPSFEAGTYQVWMGLYEWQSGERLPVHATVAPVDADRLLLSDVKLP